MKNRSIFVLPVLAAVTLFVTACGFRPEGAALPGAELTGENHGVSEAAATPAPQVKTVTVTYRLEGETLSTEEVPEGGTPAKAPTFAEDRAILSWKNTGGGAVELWSTPVTEPITVDAVLGPALERRGGFFDAGTDGLFHPLDPFTRSDAVRAVYGILDIKPSGETFLKDVTTHARCWQAATTLVTAGYISLDAAGKFYPDVAISPEDLSFMLEKLFSKGAVEAAMAGLPQELTRAQAAVLLDTLLELEDVAKPPYYPDVAPTLEGFAAIERVGIRGNISWVKGERAEPGFVNLEGYLYDVGEDGYFLRDTMIGTLYFDVTGRYTSGDTAVDDYVAGIIERNTKMKMSRDEMLRAVYDYVRDHYLYLKRNLYETGETGWELPEALLMFQSGKGNCYNFSGAFWALARGVGYDAVCYAGLVGKDRDPHSWVEIKFDGVAYIFDVETEMSYRLVNDYITSMYKITYERGEIWSYIRDPEEAAQALAEKAAAKNA